jgi:hypothetical protein
MNIQTQIPTPLVKHWVHYCWWRLIQAANKRQLLRNIKRSDNVTEQYTINLPSTIAFYGRHLKNCRLLYRGFCGKLSQFLLHCCRSQIKAHGKANNGNRCKEKGNSHTYNYRCEARGALGCRPLRPPPTHPLCICSYLATRMQDKIINIKTVNRSFENVVSFKYMWMTVTNHSYNSMEQSPSWEANSMHS